MLNEGRRRVTEMLDPAHMHAGTMAPIGIASPATLAGLFLVLDARTGDQRLALAGMRTSVLVAARLAVVMLAALLATAVSLGVTATVFDAHQWGVYAAANVLIGMTYAPARRTSRTHLRTCVAGAFIAFLVPFLEIGIGQSPMLRGEPASWAHYLPGYGGTRVLIDGALTASFDETRALLIALGWLAALALAATALFPPTARPAHG